MDYAEPGPLDLAVGIIQNEKDGSLLVRIPMGEFVVGENQVKETGHRTPDRADWGRAVWKDKSLERTGARGWVGQLFGPWRSLRLGYTRLSLADLVN